MKDVMNKEDYIRHRIELKDIGKYDVIQFGLGLYSLTEARGYKDRAIIHLLRETGGDDTTCFKSFDPKCQKARILWHGLHPLGYYIWSEADKKHEEYEPCLRQMYLLLDTRGVGLGRLMWWDFYNVHKEAGTVWVESPNHETCRILEAENHIRRDEAKKQWIWLSNVRFVYCG